MLRRSVLLAALLLAPGAWALGVPSLESPADGAPPRDRTAAASYRVNFRCPDAVPGTGVPAACPVYVLDREDVLGSPLLVVDPLDPSRAAFGALHGGRGLRAVPGDEPPTGRSRDDAIHQPHTVFSTGDGGYSWRDMPYHAPDALQAPGREIYGDDHAIALDARGRLHIAALYSYREASAPLGDGAPFQNVVALWKAHGVGRPIDYHVNLKLMEPASDPAARIDSIHLVPAPAADAVAVVWREAPPAGEARVVLRWTRGSDGALWRDADPGIAGCDAISNPLAVDAEILLACRAGEAWSIHAIDTAAWTARIVGDAPIATAHALLVDRGAGYVILVGSGLDVEGGPRLQVVYGERGAYWSAPEELAEDAAGAALALDARVTAAAYNPLTGNLHLVYLERHDVAATDEGARGRPEFVKSLVSVQAEGAFQARLDLGIGAVNRAAFAPTLTGVGGDVYDDLHDGLFIWNGPGGEVREFLAFGDYGFVRYAEIVEENFLSPIAPPAPQAPPVPLASAGSVPVLVGVPAGLLAGAMVARTLWARKKATAEAPSE